MRDESTAAFNYAEELRKLATRGIVVLGGGADETPGIYKDPVVGSMCHASF